MKRIVVRPDNSITGSGHIIYVIGIDNRPMAMSACTGEMLEWILQSFMVRYDVYMVVYSQCNNLRYLIKDA